jgi:CRISPR-associated protein Csm1
VAAAGLENQHADGGVRPAIFAIAGLLHDVGKILEPAEFTLGPEAKSLEAHICPTDARTGRPTHRHVLFTAQALFSSGLRVNGIDIDFMRRIAWAHHRPGDGEESILQVADRLASGHDRRATDPSEESVVTGLISIASRLRRDAHDGDQLPTSPLSFDARSFFPRAAQPMSDYRLACKNLSDKLIQGLGKPFATPAEAVDGIDALLHHVATSVPASRARSEAPDISLYDHSRIVGAFAACLAAQVGPGAPHGELDHATFRLVSLSLGGIQDFIFRRLALADSPGSPDKGMAKQLRGRSFLVSLITALAARRVLNALALPSLCKLLDAGGRTVLLVPGGTNYMAAIESVERSIRSDFSRELGGPLRLDMAVSDSLSVADFSAARFSATYRRLLDRVDQRRRSGAVTVLRQNGCWAESGWVFDAAAMPVDRAAFAARLRAIGQSLPRARYLAIDSRAADADTHLSLFGFSARLHNESPGIDHLALELEGDLTRPTLLTGNYVPRLSGRDVADDEDGREGDPVPFDVLAGRSTDDRGNPVGMEMLAAIKADVDRLGWLFSYALKDRLSFGRLATLSRAIDGFFKSFVREKLRSHFPNLYTVFAGGDDLFLIGPWYDVVRFSRAIRQDFRAFSADNPNLTFSAGIVFAKPGASIRVLAESADEAIETAKRSGRDRVTIAGSTLTWQDMERALRLHAMLGEAFSGSDHRRGSLLYRLFDYASMARRCSQSAPTLADLKWRSQMSYDLRRNLSSTEMTPSVSAVYRELAGITSADAEMMRIATMLTLYASRGGAE